MQAYKVKKILGRTGSSSTIYASIRETFSYMDEINTFRKHVQDYKYYSRKAPPIFELILFKHIRLINLN